MTYNTETKESIISFLSKNEEKAFSAEEICQAVLVGGHGKSTVFRILSRLVDDGTIKRITDSKTRRVTYQHVSCIHCKEHLHLMCRGCGALIHLDEETSNLVERSISKCGKFTLDSDALLYGVCENCNVRRGV